jgi:hypothetical protein
MSLLKVLAPVAFLSLSLVACGSGEKKPDKPASTSLSTTTTSGSSGTTAAPTAGCSCAASGTKGCDCAHCVSSDHKDACSCSKK